MMSSRLRAAIAAVFLFAMPIGEAVAYDGFAWSPERPVLASRIESEARRRGVPPRIALSIATTSAPRRDATGPMNVVPSVARHYGFAGRDIRDPARNIETGVRLLDHLYHRFGTWDRAVLAYQWGPPAGARGLAGASREQRIYVSLVLDRQPVRRDWTRGARQSPAPSLQFRGRSDDLAFPGDTPGYSEDDRSREGGRESVGADYAPPRPSERGSRRRDQGGHASPSDRSWAGSPAPTYQASKDGATLPPMITAPPAGAPPNPEPVEAAPEPTATTAAERPDRDPEAATPPRSRAERVEIVRERAPVNLAPPAPDATAPDPAKRELADRVKKAREHKAEKEAAEEPVPAQ